jgi:hypothetical protein
MSRNSYGPEGARSSAISDVSSRLLQRPAAAATSAFMGNEGFVKLDRFRRRTDGQLKEFR